MILEKTNNFYLDTSIWLDFYEERGVNGEKALKLNNKLVDENKIILYSNIVVRELKKLGYSQEEIFDMFRIAKPDNIRKVHIYDENVREVHRISIEKGISLADVLHAVLSRENDAQLISRDRDFQELRFITISKFPEDFISN
jgi:predicted nucleic acid-binding protein